MYVTQLIVTIHQRMTDAVLINIIEKEWMTSHDVDSKPIDKDLMLTFLKKSRDKHLGWLLLPQISLPQNRLLQSAIKMTKTSSGGLRDRVAMSSQVPVVGLRDRVAIIRALLHAISSPQPYAGYGDLIGVGRRRNLREAAWYRNWPRSR